VHRAPGIAQRQRDTNDGGSGKKIQPRLQLQQPLAARNADRRVDANAGPQRAGFFDTDRLDRDRTGSIGGIEELEPAAGRVQGGGAINQHLLEWEPAGRQETEPGGARVDQHTASLLVDAQWAGDRGPTGAGLREAKLVLGRRRAVMVGHKVEKEPANRSVVPPIEHARLHGLRPPARGEQRQTIRVDRDAAAERYAKPDRFLTSGKKGRPRPCHGDAHHRFNAD
jgi:hypothetical protein